MTALRTHGLAKLESCETEEAGTFSLRIFKSLFFLVYLALSFALSCFWWTYSVAYFFTMRLTLAALSLLSPLVVAQTYTDCNPTKNSKSI
jgi:hypothetical protein